MNCMFEKNSKVLFENLLSFVTIKMAERYSSNMRGKDLSSPSSYFPEDDYLTAMGSSSAASPSASAVTVIESIVEEVVSLISDKAFSIPNDNNDPNSDFNRSNVEDVIKLMLNGSGPSVPVMPVASGHANDGDGENKANVSINLQDLSVNWTCKQDLGDFLPQEGQGISSETAPELHDSFNSSEERHIGNFCEFVNSEGTGSTGTGTSSGGTANKGDDATNILMMMKMLVDENKRLRKMMGKLKRVTALVMSKYRNSMTFLLNELDVYKSDYREMMNKLKEGGQKYDPQNAIFKLNSTIAEMKHVMYEAARSDDTVINIYEQKIAQLQYENQGLHKMVQIALDYGGEHLLTYVNKSVQTEETPPDPDTEEEPEETVIPTDKESIFDVCSPSNEHDDVESYHTADNDSLSGSTLSLVSLTQEPDGGYVVSEEIPPLPPASPLPEIVLPPLQSAIPKIGDQDKVEFDAEEEGMNINSVLLDVSSK